MTEPSARIEAAGGVVWRPGASERAVEVVVVHRPKYDDWTFPKGKLTADESHAEGALREVGEETGLRCEAGRELASTYYVDHRGRPKRVRYWAMTVIDGEFRPNDEVDEMRWLSVAGAAQLLSYERDRSVLSSLVEPPAASHPNDSPP